MKKLLLFAGFLFLLSAAITAQSAITDDFFEKVKYRGAFGTTDWTKGWSNFDPQNTQYPTANVTIEGVEINTNTTWTSNNAYVFGKQKYTAAALANNSVVDKTPNYIGAFGSTDWTKGWANYDPQNQPYFNVTDTIKPDNANGEITTNRTLTRGKTYLLKDWIYVVSGVTLTIQSGVQIRGDKATKGALIIEPGAKIIANGTAVDPIVFTSNQATGSRSYGDWGGLVICGKATTNQSDPVIEGGPRTHYGGTDDADNSGSLKYVRIEFPGIAFMPDKEINGLTFGGVGSGTSVDYIQVSYSGDDSYEWFGGTVNCKHLIAFRGWDDDFDTDFGFRGVVQFAVALRDPAIADPGSGSNGFESDNDAAGDFKQPYTNAVFTNVSLFGPYATPSATVNANFKRAMHIRRNSRLQVYNSVFAGWGTGILFEGKQVAVAGSDSIHLENNVMAGMNNDFAVTSGQWTNEAAGESAWFLAKNDTLSSIAGLQLNDAFNLTAPNFTAAKTAYLVKGFIYVTNGATLTIEKGTVIRGDKASKGSLIVEPGGKLIANGTADEPIVFTSNQAAGFRSYGDWGGVILCGKAPVNQTDPIIEGGPRTHYGGTDAADNSGSLKYVRIEFPGIAFQPDKEINGLTFGGVGSSTSIENIQVSYSGDDSYEWFGGTVNCKHLIALRGWDDEYDTDFGYVGKIQFAVALRDPQVADPQSGSNGFESDNDAAGDFKKPYTGATFSNFSLFGPLATPTTSFNNNFKRAMHLRRNTRLNIYNSIFAGYPTGLLFEGKQVAITNTDSLILKNNTMAGMTTDFAVTSGQWTNEVKGEAIWYLANNDTLATVNDLKIKDAFNLTAPNFLPADGSPVLLTSTWAVQSLQITGAADITTDGGFVQLAVNYTPDAAINKEVNWSIIGSTPVEYSQTGKISGNSADNGNGTIKVVAALKDNANISDTVEIKISGQKGDAILVTEIVLSVSGGKSSVISDKAGNVQLKATVLPGNSSVSSVSWSITSGDALASVDQTGKVTADGTADGTVTVKATATDGSGISGTIDISIQDQTVSVKQSKSESFKAYPNPAVDVLNISLGKSMESACLYNMTGAVVKFANGINAKNAQLTVSDLQSGIYILKVIDVNGVSTTKRIVKK